MFKWPGNVPVLTGVYSM